MLAAQGSYGDCDDGRLDDGRAEREEPDFPFGLGVHIAQRSDAWIVPQIKIPAGRRTAGPTPNCSLGCRRSSVGGLARPAQPYLPTPRGGRPCSRAREG
jgi:hypothetical protein